MKQCAICDKKIDREDAPLLTIAGYGIPKYLCDDCSADLDAATLSKDPNECADAIGRIGEKMANHDPDGATYKNVCEILDAAKVRAKSIADGEYDFSLDEAEDDTFDEIPEDMLESEEDKALDAKDEETARKVNKVFDWMYIGAGIGIMLFIIWKVLDTFVL